MEEINAVDTKIRNTGVTGGKPVHGLKSRKKNLLLNSTLLTTK